MYSYQAQRSFVFTEDGVVMLMQIKTQAAQLIEVAGAATVGKIMKKIAGSTWDMLACVDFLKEKKILTELTIDPDTWGQDRVFVKGPEWHN